MPSLQQVVELFIFHNQQQAKKDRAKKPKAATAATGGNTSASAAKASGGVNNGGKGENGSKAAHSPRVPGTDLRQKQMEVVEKWWSKKVAAGVSKPLHTHSRHCMFFPRCVLLKLARVLTRQGHTPKE